MRIYRLLILGLTLLSLGIWVSCKRMDIPANNVKTENMIEEKFFSFRKPQDQHTRNLAALIKREDDRLHFVEKTIRQIGYPYWDKSVVVKKAAGNGRGTSEEVIFTFVPFVRDTQDYVNSLLVFRTEGEDSDTSYKWLCDWQYQEREFGSYSTTSTAESFSMLFMVLDNYTLGHENFQLTDSALFDGNPILTNAPYRYIGLKSTSVSGSSVGGRGARSQLAAEEICVEGFLCYSNVQSSYMRSSSTTTVSSCNGGYYEYEICWDLPNGYVIGENGWNTGGGGSGTGGGGSGPGGGGPPECNGGGNQRSVVVQGCGPGWLPMPGGLLNPCDKVIPLISDPDYRASFSELKNKTSENKEYAYRMDNDGTYILFTGPDGGKEVSISVYETIRGYIHSHFAGGMSIFTVGDFETIAILNNADKINLNTATFGLATQGGSYVLTVESNSKFSAFLNEYFSSSDSKEKFESQYIRYNIGTLPTVDQNITAFLSFLKNSDAGVALLKANEDFTGFTKVTLDNTNQLVYTPCS